MLKDADTHSLLGETDLDLTYTAGRQGGTHPTQEGLNMCSADWVGWGGLQESDWEGTHSYTVAPIICHQM